MDTYLKDSAQAFIDSQEFAETTRNQYLRMLFAVGSYESRIREPIYRMSPDDLYNGFSVASKNADRIGKLRSLMERYFDWLSERGVDVSVGVESLSEVGQKSEEHISTLQYFYSIHQLVAKTDHDTQYVSGVEFKLPTDYRMLRSAFILAWYGIRLEDALRVEKNDVLRNHGFITFDGKVIEVDSAAYEILRECATANEYTKGKADNRFLVKYCATEKLFRTDIKVMTLKAIRDSISLFNGILRRKSTTYNVNKIYWSGKFSRAYLFERNGGLDGVVGEANLMKVYEMLFDETYTARNQYQERQQEYRLYKSVLDRTK